MLLTGQPLHAFDLDRVEGATLIVRRARDGEQIETLDGQTRTLDADMVLIEDAAGPTSIAGVMGGARSEVGADTTRVLMEAANWDGANIHRTSLKLGLRSEASGRFEKQLQPEQAMEAQAVVDPADDRPVRRPPRAGDDRRRRGRAAAEDDPSARGAGREPARSRRSRASAAGEILEALEFKTADADDGLDVTVPPFRRGDVTREADLIEEVARIDGLDKLPSTLPSRHEAHAQLTPRQKMRRRAADALTAQGLDEIVGWSLGGPELADRLRLGTDHPLRRALELENPLSGDLSVLRTTLLGSLLDTARHNRARGAGTIRLFEAGAVYLPDGDCRVAARALSRRRRRDRTGAPGHVARRPAAGGRLLRDQGRAGGAARHAARAVDRRARRRAVPAPGPRGEHPGRRRTRWLGRRDPSAGRRRMGSRRNRGGLRARTSTRWRCGRRRCTAR